MTSNVRCYKFKVAPNFILKIPLCQVFNIQSEHCLGYFGPIRRSCQCHILLSERMLVISSDLSFFSASLTGCPFFFGLERCFVQSRNLYWVSHSLRRVFVRSLAYLYLFSRARSCPLIISTSTSGSFPSADFLIVFPTWPK